MRSDRWRRVNEVLQRAFERDGDDRLAFVREVCVEQPEIVREVEALLAAHDDAGSFLETSPRDVERLGEDRRHTLESGAQIGAYEVSAWIGSGGMGEVYRARDTRLDRDVALKVLPPAFLEDADRLARFEREARVLASLDHPGIAAIHGVEETESVRALVLELVDGPTLADRITQGPIPLDEVLPVAIQIAEAMEVAHDRGIVHRDLKPANIKVRADGTVKILDFGLAKALDHAPEGDPTRSATITTTALASGVVLGTAAYMSPEQARGRPADRRSDVWAFGCLLFEMLTGERAFEADGVPDTVAAVLARDVPWDRLDPAPPAIRQLLRRCLDKDARTRLRDIGEARITCEWVRDHPTGGGTSPIAREMGVADPVSFMRLLVAAGLAAVGVGIGYGLWGRAPAAPPPETAFSISMPPGVNQAGVRQLGAEISSDGRHLVYVGERDGQTQLYHRPLESVAAVAIAGTTGARRPFLSPDGTSVGFYLDDTLRRVPLAGGPSSLISPVPDGIVGPGAFDFATWTDDDTIWFGGRTIGLHRVPATGGAPTPVTTVDSTTGELGHWMPRVLPGGDAVLYGVWRGDLGGQQVGVYDGQTGEHRTLVDGGRLAYATTGHLLYEERPPTSVGPPSGRLLAVRFDPDTLELAGDPVPVLEDLELLLHVGRDGTLVYTPRSRPVDIRTLVWVDPEGNEEPLDAPPGAYAWVRVSPDGQRIAFVRDHDVWVHDLERGGQTRLTTDAGLDLRPTWSPDGRRIVFSSNRGDARAYHFALFETASDGSSVPRLLLDDPDRSLVVTSWHPHGQILLAQHNLADRWQAGELNLDGTRRWELLPTGFGRQPRFSPNGDWLTYVSKESGENLINLRPYPDIEGGRWLISPGGTPPSPNSTGRVVDAVWSADGRHIFYRDVDAGTMMSVTMETDPEVVVSPPRVLFEDSYFLPGRIGHFDIGPDGRFLMIKTNLGLGGGLPYRTDRWTAESQRIRVVQNWVQNLDQRVPTN